MLRTILPAALLLSATLSPAGAAAASSDAGLREAQRSISSMKRSAGTVRELSSSVDSSDQVAKDCVEESSQIIEETVAQAEATIDAAVGWGPDVAAAVARAVREARATVAAERAQAFECAGVEDEEALALEGEDADLDEEEEERMVETDTSPAGSYDPFSPDVASGAGSVALSHRDPAASPTK